MLARIGSCDPTSNAGSGAGTGLARPGGRRTVGAPGRGFALAAAGGEKVGGPWDNWDSRRKTRGGKGKSSRRKRAGAGTGAGTVPAPAEARPATSAFGRAGVVPFVAPWRASCRNRLRLPATRRLIGRGRAADYETRTKAVFFRVPARFCNYLRQPANSNTGGRT